MPRDPDDSHRAAYAIFVGDPGDLVVDLPRKDIPVSTCKSCKAPIIWRTTTTGKSMPIDASPSERGDIQIGVVNGEVVAVVLGPESAAEAREAGRVLYVSHFATCPSAAEHRQ